MRGGVGCGCRASIAAARSLACMLLSFISPTHGGRAVSAPSTHEGTGGGLLPPWTAVHPSSRHTHCTSTRSQATHGDDWARHKASHQHTSRFLIVMQSAGNPRPRPAPPKATRAPSHGGLVAEKVPHTRGHTRYVYFKNRVLLIIRMHPNFRCRGRVASPFLSS
jgi:hypothetical protein